MDCAEWRALSAASTRRTRRCWRWSSTPALTEAAAAVPSTARCSADCAARAGGTVGRKSNPASCCTHLKTGRAVVGSRWSDPTWANVGPGSNVLCTRGANTPGEIQVWEWPRSTQIESVEASDDQVPVPLYDWHSAFEMRAVEVFVSQCYSEIDLPERFLFVGLERELRAEETVRRVRRYYPGIPRKQVDQGALTPAERLSADDS